VLGGLGLFLLCEQRNNTYTASAGTIASLVIVNNMSTQKRPIKGEDSETEEKPKVDIIMDDELKPGQKYPTPTPGEGTRVYYESLFHQKPESELAQEYCVNYGILEWKLAWKVYKKICTRKGITPVKPTRKKEKEEEEEAGVVAPRGAWDHAIEGHLRHHKKSKGHHHPKGGGGRRAPPPGLAPGEDGVVVDTGLGDGVGYEGVGMSAFS